ncbi:MAG: hypothetical protein KC502_14700 [Myxococcales bacterium]|nr:hypothetical protein [Myxococcales bacterium]
MNQTARFLAGFTAIALLALTPGCSDKPSATDTAAADASAGSDVAGASDGATDDTGAAADVIAADAGTAAGDVAAADDSTTVAPNWSKFGINRGAGPCPPGKICTWAWTVTPEGKWQAELAGTNKGGTMDEDDLTALLAIANSSAFHKAMNAGFSCGQPPTDVSVSFTLWRVGVVGTPLKQDVTGCVFGNPQDNIAQKLNALLTPYGDKK